MKPYSSPEGLFFPDTYHYVYGDSDWSILQRAHSAMNAVLKEEWAQRASSLPYESPYEAVIMASIIERETGLPESVSKFLVCSSGDCQRGMLLQTDPQSFMAGS